MITNETICICLFIWISFSSRPKEIQVSQESILNSRETFSQLTYKHVPSVLYVHML